MSLRCIACFFCGFSPDVPFLCPSSLVALSACAQFWCCSFACSFLSHPLLSPPLRVSCCLCKQKRADGDSGAGARGVRRVALWGADAAARCQGKSVSSCLRVVSLSCGAYAPYSFSCCGLLQRSYLVVRSHSSQCGCALSGGRQGITRSASLRAVLQGQRFHCFPCLVRSFGSVAAQCCLPLMRAAFGPSD